MTDLNTGANGGSSSRSHLSKVSVSTSIGLAPSAAEFVPKLASSSGKVTSPTTNSTFGNSNQGIVSMSGLNSSAAAWVPPSSGSASASSSKGVIDASPSESAYPSVVDSDANQMAGVDEPMVEVTWNGSTFFVPTSMAYAYSGQNEEGDGTNFGENAAQPDIGLDWSFGASTLPAPPKRTLQTIGIPDPIRQHFQSLDVEASRQLPPDDDRYNEVPAKYHSIFLLDSATVHRGAGGSFGYPSSLYKVTDKTDGQLYALRRFDNIRNSQTTVIKSALTRWLEVRHPAVVSLYSISQERGGALFFAHAYHPTAVTLKQRFIDSTAAISEPMLWRIITQLLSGLRLIHARGIAVRHVSPIHIILTSGTMVRFNSVGVADVLEFESRKTMAELQVDDIVKLGYVVFSLASRVVVSQKNAEAAGNHLRQNYTVELCRVVAAMVSGRATVAQVSSLMAEKIQDELDSSLAAADALHSHLRSEYENGRMLRLFLKLGFINERPEYALAPEWSETGDRYVLKLFRDYVFHQTLEDGAPVLDAGHVLSCLNKLDAGDAQKILLCSRDSKDMLVVSYADVRRCLESAFSDLSQLSDAALDRMNTHVDYPSVGRSLASQSFAGPGNSAGLSLAAPTYVPGGSSAGEYGGGMYSSYSGQGADLSRGGSSRGAPASYGAQSVPLQLQQPAPQSYGHREASLPYGSGSKTPQPSSTYAPSATPALRHSISAGSGLSQQAAPYAPDGYSYPSRGPQSGGYSDYGPGSSGTGGMNGSPYGMTVSSVPMNQQAMGGGAGSAYGGMNVQRQQVMVPPSGNRYSPQVGVMLNDGPRNSPVGQQSLPVQYQQPSRHGMGMQQSSMAGRPMSTPFVPAQQQQQQGGYSQQYNPAYYESR